VRVRWARARECLPSSRELTSRNPWAAWTPTFNRLCSFAHRFAFYPLVLRVSGASSFLLASALPCLSPRGLATSRRTRRAMRPIDFCHPNETACTRTSYVPGYLPRFSPRGRLPEFGLRTAWPGDRALSRRSIRFGGSSRTQHSEFSLCDLASCFAGCWPAAATSVGVFFPRRPRSTEPLTSLSPLPLPLASSPTFAGCCVLRMWRSRRDHRDRLPVKTCGSWWSGMPSIVGDPS